MKRILLFLSSYIIVIGVAVTLWLTAFSTELQQTKLHALLGDARAQYSMGLAYDTGKGVEADADEAKQWYKKAAAQGLTQAGVNLGILLVKDGGEEDKKAALAYFRRAAEEGDTLAIMNVARSAFLGVGMEKDDAEGAMWMKKAAESGVRDAQGMMGALYLGGIGVEQDLNEGITWLKKAGTTKDLVTRLEAELAPINDLPPETREEQMQLMRDRIREEIHANFKQILKSGKAQAAQPIVERPEVTEQVVTEEPATEQPAAEQPATEQPAPQPVEQPAGQPTGQPEAQPAE